MFSTAQQSYIDSILPTYADMGYKYYVCYTDSSSSGYNDYHPDLYFIFSDKQITSDTGYKFTYSDSIQVAIYTGNVSTYNQAQRLQVTSLSAGSRSVPVYEHIYSNASFTGTVVQPNYYISSRGLSNAQQNAFMLGVGVIVFFCFFTRLFRFGKRGSF